MRTIRLTVAAAVLFLVPALEAQQYTPRQTLISIMETQKRYILRLVDVAPDSMLGFRPTPGVRTFAEQIEHAAFSNAAVGHIIAVGPQNLPVLGDSTVYRRNKAELRAFAERAMDHAVEMIRGVPDAEMMTEITLFGNRLPRHRAFMMLLDHFPWTLGQTVPYLRLNGVTPPAYSPF